MKQGAVNICFFLASTASAVREAVSMAREDFDVATTLAARDFCYNDGIAAMQLRIQVSNEHL